MFLFGRQLEHWAKDAIVKLNGKRKSLALPAGTVGFRGVAAKMVIDDQKEVGVTPLRGWRDPHPASCHINVHESALDKTNCLTPKDASTIKF